MNLSLKKVKALFAKYPKLSEDFVLVVKDYTFATNYLEERFARTLRLAKTFIYKQMMNESRDQAGKQGIVDHYQQPDKYNTFPWSLKNFDRACQMISDINDGVLDRIKSEYSQLEADG